MNKDRDRKPYEDTMDRMGDKVENTFDQAKGWIKEKWGWLTDDDLLETEGRAEKIQAKVRDHYGEERWEAEYRKFSDEYPQYDLGDKVGNKFDQAKGWMKEKWGWLTDDDLLELEGRAEKIKAKVKDHFGERWEDEYRKFTDAYPDYK